MNDFYGMSVSMFQREPDISQEERDNLIHFNTKRYWHCWYDCKSHKLYNEYGYLIMDNAYQYLLGANLIDKNSNQLMSFESE